MAVPVGITALELNNNVIQKASTKHYLHNILLKLYKGSIYHCKSTSLIFTIKEEQCDNNKKGITTESIEKQKPLSNRSENRSEEIISTHTHTHAHTPNTCCQRLMRVIYMSGWYSQGWGRGHSVENCVTHWFTGSHNRSFLSRRHTQSYTVHTHTHTHARVLQSIQKFHKIPNFHQLLNPVKRGYKSLFFPFNLQSVFFPFNLSLYSVPHPWMALVFWWQWVPVSWVKSRATLAEICPCFFGWHKAHRLPTGRAVTSPLPHRSSDASFCSEN